MQIWQVRAVAEEGQGCAGLLFYSVEGRLGREGGRWDGADRRQRHYLVISSHVGHRMVEAEEVDVLASEQGHLGKRLADGVEELTQTLQEARLADVVRGLKVGNALSRRTQPERIAIEGKWGLPPGWWDDPGDAKLLNQGPNGAKVGKRVGKLGQGRAQGRAIDAFLRFTHPRAAQEGASVRAWGAQTTRPRSRRPLLSTTLTCHEGRGVTNYRKFPDR